MGVMRIRIRVRILKYGLEYTIVLNYCITYIHLFYFYVNMNSCQKLVIKTESPQRCSNVQGPPTRRTQRRQRVWVRAYAAVSDVNPAGPVLSSFNRCFSSSTRATHTSSALFPAANLKAAFVIFAFSCVLALQQTILQRALCFAK